MGLHLTGKGSILDAIGGGLNTAGNAIVSGLKDVGDVGSADVASLTGNKQAWENANNAITNNGQNLAHGDLATNLGGLSQDVGLTPAAKSAIGVGIGAGTDLSNLLTGQNQTSNQVNEGTSLGGIANWASNGGKTNLGSGRELAGNTIMTGVNLATAGKGKALEQSAEDLLRNKIGTGTIARVVTPVVAGAGTGATYGFGQGTGTAVQSAQTPEEAARDIIKPTLENAAFGSAIPAITKIPEGITATREALASHIPLNEVGGGTFGEDITPPPAGSAEDAIHQHNPLAPAEPTTTPLSEPSATDLAAATRAAEQMNAPAPIDFSQVDGAGQRLTQAIADRTNALQQMESGLKGGVKVSNGEGGLVRSSEHTPFYRKVYEETGHAPRKADWQAEAERQLRSGSDAESLNYQNIARHAEAEKEVKAYQQADRQSGYNKVKLKNAPAGTPRSIPSYVKEKIASPEYVAKRQVGELLQRVRDELAPARAHVKALDQQIKNLGKTGDLKGITALNAENVAARLKLRYLEGQERIQSGEYGRRQQALDDKYPGVALRQKGKNGKVTVSGVPVQGIDRAIESRPAEATTKPIASTSGKPAAKYDLAEVLGHPLTHEPYKGPNLNEGAFSAEDIKNLMSHNGQYASDGETASYSPDHDLTLPTEAPAPPARNLAADTAAFNKLTGGGTVEEAVKAYQETAGVSREEAQKAVNAVAETGADMGSNEDVLKRNPAYGNTPDFKTPTIHDVSDKAKSYQTTSDLLQSRMADAAKDMSGHDIALLDKLRGNAIADVAKDAENPEQFIKVAEAAKTISDYNHEIRRQNGDSTIYRQNYGAGMHYSDVTPEEKAAVSGYRDELASTPGFSKERLIGDYEKAKQYDLTRKNGNFLEDVAHDQRQTMAFVRERAIYRGIQEAAGDQAVHYGNPTFEQPKQLNGTKDVFATKEVADKWNKLHPQKIAKTGVIKAVNKGYRGASSFVVQATAVNPFIHGSNLETQAFIAAGKMGGEGTAGFLKNQATATAEQRAAARLGRLQHGDHMPSYGAGEDGFVSRMTHGVTDINKDVMARIDNHIRDDLYMTYTDLGMDGREAVKTMEKFLGDGRAIGEASQNLGFFVKFAKTMIGALAETPKSKGTLLNAAIAAGVVWAVNKAFQEWTGNKHAHLHTPGELGIAKDIVTSGEDIYHKHYGQATSTVTNRVNPIVKEGAQQLFNKDLYTGKPLDQSGSRVSHAAGALFPEAQSAGKVNSGSKSAQEAVANFFGVYTPHAKGAPAAPSGDANFLNAPKAKAPATGDKTGIDQQNAYFNTAEAARNTLPGARQKVYDQITAGETDANGQPIGMNDKQAQAHYAELASNPDILAAVTKQKQDYAKATGTQVDPLYSADITPEQRQEYLHMQALPYKGDDYIQQQDANNSWVPQLTQDRVAYFATQDFSGAPPSQRIVPPTFDDSTQANMNQASSLAGAEKVAFIDAHPDVQQAYDQIAKYTNDRRVAEGNAPFKLYPHADPETQSIINQYLAMDKSQRSAFIKGSPDAYAKLQNYFTSESEWELANSAGQDKFEGATPSQTELKSAYNLGQYDIAPVKNADGTTSYSLDPQAAYQASLQTGAGKALSSAKATTLRREATNAIKYAGRSKRVTIRTSSQNKRKLPRYGSSKVRVAKASTGKLRVKSVPIG